MPVTDYQQIQIPSNYAFAKRLETRSFAQAEQLGYDEEAVSRCG